MSKGIALLLVVLFAVGAVLAGLESTSSRAAAASSCRTVTGTVTSTANFSNFTTQGTSSGDLQGTTFFQGDASSLTPVTASSSPPLNPTEHYTGNFTINTQHGVLKTRSVGVFEPIGNGLGTQFDRVLGNQSTGQFARATGQLYFNFQSDSSGTQFTSTYSGQICR